MLVHTVVGLYSRLQLGLLAALVDIIDSSSSR